MEHTCTLSNECPLWKKYKEKCPNYIQTTWKDDKGNVKIINDCSPKRTMLMIQELYNRIIGVEKAQEQQRNELVYFIGAEEEKTGELRNIIKNLFKHGGLQWQPKKPSIE